MANVVINIYPYAPRHPAMDARDVMPELSTPQDDLDRQHEIERKYSNGETLTEEEMDFMRRRGAVRF